MEKIKNAKETKRENEFKKSLLNRISRAQGQLNGIKKMVENDVYCDDILNQIAAVRAALNSTSKVILESHIKNCIVKKIEDKDYDILDEITTTINKLLK